MRLTILLVLCAATAMALPAQTFTTIFSFDQTNGATPTAGLVQAANGDFYGTTQAGGTHLNGTVFKITPGGTLTTLYNFCSQSACADGGFPVAGLVLATNGYFYGVTAMSGAHGYGTIFKISPSGTLTKSVRHKSEESGLIRPPETAPSNPRTSR